MSIENPLDDMPPLIMEEIKESEENKEEKKENNFLDREYLDCNEDDLDDLDDIVINKANPRLAIPIEQIEKAQKLNIEIKTQLDNHKKTVATSQPTQEKPPVKLKTEKELLKEKLHQKIKARKFQRSSKKDIDIENPDMDMLSSIMDSPDMAKRMDNFSNISEKDIGKLSGSKKMGGIKKMLEKMGQ